MGWGNNETGVQWDGGTMKQERSKMREQWDRGAMAWVNNGTGAQWEGGTMGQGRNWMGEQWDGGTVGWGNNGDRGTVGRGNNWTGAQRDRVAMGQGRSGTGAYRDIPTVRLLRSVNTSSKILTDHSSPHRKKKIYHSVQKLALKIVTVSNLHMYSTVSLRERHL